MTNTQRAVELITDIDGLVVDLTDGILTLTLDRPDSLNSLTPGLLRGMAEALEGSGTDPRIRVVRVDGTGRGFCSGASIGADSPGRGHDPTETVTLANRVIRAIVDLPRPVVAVVHGAVAGVGVSLALACDVVLASQDAFFLLAFTKVGLMPDGGATALVAANIGRTRAMRMALLAERVTAADALDWGLVSSVCAPEDLHDHADALVEKLLAGPSVALAKTKHAINCATLGGLDAALARETTGQSVLLAADDRREGVKAFQEKRPPHFTDT